jgi:hypothetical protein
MVGEDEFSNADVSTDKFSNVEYLAHKSSNAVPLRRVNSLMWVPLGA